MSFSYTTLHTSCLVGGLCFSVRASCFLVASLCQIQCFTIVQGEVKDEDFRNYFEQFGEIDDCVVRHLYQNQNFLQTRGPQNADSGHLGQSTKSWP